ncbi:MAG: tubulin-like doman-containing protein [Acidobacteriota bacterium]|nr:tubulin-like doman-containing protein [Blastocatellia bacterium]MDW8412357.1 tubulin-like doman-containing protein [Acidobacteriota bacterium]
MSYRNIQATIAAKTDANASKVRPTLLIGIGGTGGNVLQRVRNWVIDEYGSFYNFPIIKFLHLDTDERSSKDTSKDITRDPLFKAKQFTDSEWIPLKVNVAQFLEVNSYPRLKPWFKPDPQLRRLGDLGQGAGQVRVASRLGFFHHYGQNKIRPKLEELVRQLRSIDLNRLEHPGARNLQIYTNTINVFVICSSAGGTGSGVFLDMGALLHTINGIETHLILVLPEVFKMRDPRCVANGYAALIELNHYQYDNNFTIYFEQEPRQISPPLYQHTYLVDGRCIVGNTTDDVTLYNMIASALIQDFKSGQFSDDKRSFRSNLAQYTLQVAVYKHPTPDGNREILTETLPRRYSSFGMSRIYYPREQIVKSCTYRLAAEILGYWLGGEGRAKAIDYALAFLKECRLSYEDLRRSLEIKDKLTIEQICRSKIDAKLQSFNFDQLSPGSTRELQKFTESFVRDHLREDDPKDPSRWGDFVRHIRQVCYEETIKNAHNEMLKLLKERLSHPSYGFDYVLQIVNNLPSILRGQHYREKAIQAMDAEEKQRTSAASEYQSALRELQELEGKSSWEKLFGGWKDAVQVQKDRWNESTFKYLRASGYKYVYETYIKLLDELAKIVETELRRELFSVNTLMTEKRSEFLLLSEYYRQKDDSSKIDLRLYESDLDKYYRNVVAAEDAIIESAINAPLRISRYSEDLLSHLHQIGVIEKPTVSALAENIGNDSTEKRVISKLIEFLEKKVSERINIHVLDLLFPQNYNESIVRKQVEECFNLAKGWVHFNDAVPGELYVPSGAHKMLIGVDTSHPNYRHLHKMVESFQSGSMSIDFKPIGNTHEIVFYGEIAGICLASLSSLQEMRRAFREKEKDKSQIDLFTTKNRFMMNDILYRDEDSRKRYLRSIKAFVLGLAAGVIKQTENENKYDPRDRIYSMVYYDERDTHKLNPQQKTLGMFEAAINNLYEETSIHPLREKLLEQVSEVKKKLKEEKLLEENEKFKGHLLLWYALLNELVNGERQPFPEREVELPNGDREKLVSAERECLLEEMYEISREIPAFADKNLLEKAVSTLQNNRVLFTTTWTDILRDLPKGSLHLTAFDEKAWQENKALLGEFIRGKDPSKEARRHFVLALTYGKINVADNQDITSNRKKVYSFSRPIDPLKTRFSEESLGTYEQCLAKITSSVELRSELKKMIEEAEAELHKQFSHRGSALAWIVMEKSLDSNPSDAACYNERIEYLQRRLSSAFKSDEVLRVRNLLAKHADLYCSELADIAEDHSSNLRCKMLDWQKIRTNKETLNKLLAGEEVKQTEKPTSPAEIPGEVSKDVVAKYRERVKLMIKAGQGNLGPPQRRALDNYRKQLGINEVLAKKIEEEELPKSSNTAEKYYTYATFFLGLYGNGSNDIELFRADLDKEAEQVGISLQEARNLENSITSYLDNYTALVTTPRAVEDWAREELKKMQQEYKLTDDLIKLLEDHAEQLRS